MEDLAPVSDNKVVKILVRVVSVLLLVGILGIVILCIIKPHILLDFLEWIERVKNQNIQIIFLVNSFQYFNFLFAFKKNSSFWDFSIWILIFSRITFSFRKIGIRKMFVKTRPWFWFEIDFSFDFNLSNSFFIFKLQKAFLKCQNSRQKLILNFSLETNRNEFDLFLFQFWNFISLIRIQDFSSFYVSQIIFYFINFLHSCFFFLIFNFLLYF